MSYFHARLHQMEKKRHVAGCPDCHLVRIRAAWKHAKMWHDSWFDVQGTVMKKALRTNCSDK
jgi:hypothetical protein